MQYLCKQSVALVDLFLNVLCRGQVFYLMEFLKKKINAHFYHINKFL